MEEINIDEIGLVSNDVHQISLVDWSDVSSIVKFKSEFKDYLVHLDDYSHVIVVGWLHLIPSELRNRSQAYPNGDAELPLQGALALRGGARPNPISVTVCQIIDLQENELVLKGLDLVDGTPILDIKPYIPFYDSKVNAQLPVWAGG
jgi:tRNA-Thr(GGU) m(6)t(6)A37 methyltransferase TsaA|tara:strand:+ start:9954 stop:10394 length:441 start_codon:yes stop_codon:yes gene_type:complete